MSYKWCKYKKVVKDERGINREVVRVLHPVGLAIIIYNISRAMILGLYELFLEIKEELVYLYRNKLITWW